MNNVRSFFECSVAGVRLVNTTNSAGEHSASEHSVSEHGDENVHLQKNADVHML